MGGALWVFAYFGEAMKIELKCACGAAATFEGSTYIITGGDRDAQGRVFRVEVNADSWREEHKNHATIYAPRQQGGVVYR